jgi:2'-5' RNA ligase
MSPLPSLLTDRWENRPDVPSGLGVIYWHVLLGRNPRVRNMVEEAQRRLSRFDGLHMTPIRWLHVTVLVAGTTDRISDGEMTQMLAQARRDLSQVSPITVSLSRILYHPQAIMFDIEPGRAMKPLLDAAQSATRIVTGQEGTLGSTLSRQWRPHITVCYSTNRQPAGPIVSALGTKITAGCEVTINSLDLVIQHGPERLWNWRPIGAACLSEKAKGRDKGDLPRDHRPTREGLHPLSRERKMPNGQAWR